MPLPESVFNAPFFPTPGGAPAHPFAHKGVTKREYFALEVFKALIRNGVYSEGEAVRYADILLRYLATFPPADPTVPPVPISPTNASGTVA